MSQPVGAPEPHSDEAEAVFLLPGHGAQSSALTADVEQIASDLLETTHSVTGINVSEITRRHPEDLGRPDVAQPVVYLHGFAYGRDLVQRGIKPVALAGHSLGEYAALALAGAFDFETGLHLVVARAKAITDTTRARAQMIKVIGLDAGKIEEICSEESEAWPATFNAPDEVIVRGSESTLESLAVKFREAGADRIVLLIGQGGLHTPHMEHTRKAMAAALAEAELKEPEVAVASSVSGKIERGVDRWRELLESQLYRPVRWHECFVALPANLPMIEVGPSGGLAELALRADPKRTALVVDSRFTAEAAARELIALT